MKDPEGISPRIKTLELKKHVRLAKEQLLREFPLDSVEGMNVQRVEKFILQEGLRKAPFIIFEATDSKKVENIIKEHDIPDSGVFYMIRQIKHGKNWGIYHPEMDMVLVSKNSDEKIVATFYEGLLVHELAHASGILHGNPVTDGEDHKPRVGFCFTGNRSRPWGWALEEGWADMQRAKYISQHLSPEEKRNIVEAFEDNMEWGELGEVDTNDTFPIPVHPQEILPLPVKYFVIDGLGSASVPPSAFAGYMLELLCKKDPRIPGLMLASRTSVEGLKALAQSIEGLSPGLYVELQRGPYNSNDFHRKLSMVISRLCGGVENVVRAKGPLKEKWEEFGYNLK